jgi:hypothetical protein
MESIQETIDKLKNIPFYNERELLSLPDEERSI